MQHIDAEIHEFVLERRKFVREIGGLRQPNGIVFVGPRKEIVVFLKPIGNLIVLLIVLDPTIQKDNEYAQLLLVCSSIIYYETVFIICCSSMYVASIQ